MVILTVKKDDLSLKTVYGWTLFSNFGNAAIFPK